jgi:hypothetical protein
VEYLISLFAQDNKDQVINIFHVVHNLQSCMKMQIRNINKILFSVDEFTLERIYDVVKSIALENKPTNDKDFQRGGQGKNYVSGVINKREECLEIEDKIIINNEDIGRQKTKKFENLLKKSKIELSLEGIKNDIIKIIYYNSR